MNDKKREEIQRKGQKVVRDNNYWGILKMSPRSGKTKVICDIIRDIDRRNLLMGQNGILWVAPFRDTVEELRNEVDLWLPGVIVQRITFTTNAGLHRISDRYSLIISSEVHSLSENQTNQIQALRPLMFIGETGTLNEVKEERLRRLLNAEIIFDYTIEEAIEDKIVSDYEIYVIPCDMEKNIRTINTGKGFSVTEAQQYRFLTKRFMKWKNAAKSDPKLYNLKMMAASSRADFIYKAPTKIALAKRIIDELDRCLIYTARTEVADKLAPHAMHSNRDRLLKNSPFSNDDLLYHFQEGEIDKLSVCQMAQMSVTIPNLKDIVIHQLTSNEENLVQRVFRACNREKGRIARAFICVLRGTQDEKWVRSALKGFDESKVRYLNFEELMKSVLTKELVVAPKSKVSDQKATI